MPSIKLVRDGENRLFYLVAIEVDRFHSVGKKRPGRDGVLMFQSQYPRTLGRITGKNEKTGRNWAAFSLTEEQAETVRDYVTGLKEVDTSNGIDSMTAIDDEDDD